MLAQWSWGDATHIMKSQRIDRSTALRIISATILIVGLGSAIVLYVKAGQTPGNPLGYDPEDTKQYLHDMELYGGKMNVLAADLRQWFAGLWHGKSLAFTVAFIAVLLAAGFRVAAIPLPPLAESDDGSDASRPGP
jgi:hypothetical protein